ncbi:fumarylacetoacetate hydrolase family protein [Thermohalobacter berrensis]|uniref:Hydrolase n=1 Tax=Thermohalobacter berrensis TaxID=99594 RepID=A0A419T7N0_9FIRM|nr:fumarylacetoacetate hydrolase family protein [Thermohalobacter berrensis]RKD33452.1 hydrolase [Thermohalobacter berrensis]
MYFLTYKYNNEEKIGVLSNDSKNIIPMEKIFHKLNKKTPKTMNDFIQLSNDRLIQRIKTILDTTNFDGIPKDKIKICAPIPYPKRNLICLGKNYTDHVKELMGKTIADSNIPESPIYFSKAASPAIGDGDIIKSHSSLTNQIDYEVELAIIIGKDGMNIKEDEALDYIFGYTIINDITARDIQRERKQWFKGKSLSTFSPMGPYIVHKSIIPWPVELNLESKVNGETRQKSNTRNMIFNIPYIIRDLSQGMELRAGDIILTGTPSGVGLGFEPPKFLKSGDIIECYIEKIGTLTNKIE